MVESTKQWLNQKLAERVIQNLEKNWMDGFYFLSAKQAMPKILGQQRETPCRPPPALGLAANRRESPGRAPRVCGEVQ